MAKTGNGEYHVDRVSQVDEQIRTLASHADSPQARAELFDALKTIVHLLRSTPLDWGDPERRTRRKGGLVCHGICAPLVVHYVVFEKIELSLS